MKKSTINLHSMITYLWNRFPKFWSHLLNTGLFFKYKIKRKSTYPDRVTFANGNSLFLNPEENRGKAILLRNGITQPVISHFWSLAVHHLHPTIVIDVGTNYGECIFSENYADDAKIWGIEANPYLIPYIEKSKAVHNNKEQIHIVHSLASNENNKHQDFRVDKNWSGTSSAVAIDHQEIEQILLPTITIDSLLAHLSLHHEILLFKIDVEGYEPFVLEGMRKIISSCKATTGIIEFNSQYIERTGKSLKAFYDFLTQHFNIYMYTNKKTLKKITAKNYHTFIIEIGKNQFHIDLILTTDEKVVEWLNS
jgi:FkbM family methyltransferase